VPEGLRSDFFLSRRGSVAAVAREVTDVLTERGYGVIVQDYDIPLTANFIEAMHEAIKISRDLVVLFTADYESSAYTRKEFTSFEADRALSNEERRIVILRCENVQLRGLFAPNVYQDLVGVTDAEERKRRIVAAAEGQSQAQKPPPRPFVGVPPRIASFTGRAAELDRLDSILMGRNKPAAITQISSRLGRAAVQGLGGVGKTSLAAEYAYRYRDLYAGVWWCPAETRADLMAGLAALARHLDVVGADEPDLQKTAKLGLRYLAEQRSTHLLIYDNVASPEDVADLLPTAGARVLITSRFPDWSSWADEVELDVLAPGEAIAFLEMRTGRQDPSGAMTLCDTLGRLPLALDHAAAYCRRTQMAFVDYAEKSASLIASTPRGAPYPRSVAATFDLAISAAVASCPPAEALMAYLGYCAPDRIPMELVKGAWDDDAEGMAALLSLSDVSLIKRDAFEDGGGAWTVHRLVQAVARARTGDGAAAAQRVTARLVQIYPKDGFDNPASWRDCERLTPHLIERCPPVPGIGFRRREVADLVSRAGAYFHGRGAYAAARAMYERALAIRETSLGSEDLLTAAALNNLAIVLHAQGDLTAARPLFERALAINEKMLGSDHPHVAANLKNLAGMLHARGDLSAARPPYERSLAIFEKALGPVHPDTVTSLKALAILIQAQGDLARARPLLERALALREKIHGPEHHATATSLHDLAILLQQQNDLTAAQLLLERALAIQEKVLGPEHPETAATLHGLAMLLQAKGALVSARPLLERALAAQEKALGAEHPETIAMRNDLVGLLRAQGLGTPSIEQPPTN
jgi:tetratricopeptide (TPR) repeat protein